MSSDPPILASRSAQAALLLNQLITEPRADAPGAGLPRAGASASEPTEVSALTAAVASGDPDAFAELYERWFDAMYSAVRRATGRDEAFALDAVQESFMKIIRKMRRFESEAALGAWLRVVAVRTACDMIRVEARRAARERVSAETRGASGEGAPSGAELRAVERELALLTREQADLVLARHRFGWTLDAIGRAVGLSPSAVDGRINRIVNAWSKRLEADDE